jgi:hypothetical protein
MEAADSMVEGPEVVRLAVAALRPVNSAAVLYVVILVAVHLTVVKLTL